MEVRALSDDSVWRLELARRYSEPYREPLAPALVGSGPALAAGAFPLRRFTLTRMERFGDDGVRLHYEREP